MELIPAIDIIDGKCVRLAKGDFSKETIYNNDPVELAKGLEACGIKRLHVVDLDGANGQVLKNLGTLEKIATQTLLKIDFGGGIKTTNDVEAVLNAGAGMVNLGSIIVKKPELFAQWIGDFGPEKFLPGADVLGKKIQIHGWKEETGIDIIDFIESLKGLQIQTVFCTDISRDGMMEGPSVTLYKEIMVRFPSLNLIASGGVSCYEDLLLLKGAGCSGAIIGKAIYEGKINFQQIRDFIKSN
jgi:phosphoribosylformimino-5-aminoimidazole carboxamide ribotide isomerase